MLFELIGILLIIAIVWYMLNNIPLPPPVRMVVIVIGCIFLIVIVANMFGLSGGFGHLNLR